MRSSPSVSFGKLGKGVWVPNDVLGDFVGKLSDAGAAKLLDDPAHALIRITLQPRAIHLTLSIQKRHPQLRGSFVVPVVAWGGTREMKARWKVRGETRVPIKTGILAMVGEFACFHGEGELTHRTYGR
jgi:hypothetical protein